MRRSLVWASAILAGIGLFCCFLPQSIGLPTMERPFIFYSTDRYTDMRKLLSIAIGEARRSIVLYTYTLNDKSLLLQLCSKQAQGLDVTLFYDKRANINPIKSCNHSFLHPESAGGLFHKKIWVFDSTIVFVGSTNLTTHSLDMHDNCMVGIYSPDLAEKVLGNENYCDIDLGAMRIEYLSLPSKLALSKIIHLLDGAVDSIDLNLFTFTQKDIAHAIISAHMRGVRVNICIDSTSAKGASRGTIALLAQSGIKVKISKGLQLHHHKYCIIDGKSLVVGSANWTKAAFNKNSDIIIMVHSPVVFD